MIVFASVPLIACSVMEIESGSIHRRGVNLLNGWIFQAVMAYLGGAFWWFMADANNTQDQKDEKRDMKTGTTSLHPSTTYELFI